MLARRRHAWTARRWPTSCSTTRTALKDLNGIVHPAVGAETARRIEAERDTGRVVVLDVPLLVETGRRGLSGDRRGRRARSRSPSSASSATGA